MDWRKEIEKGIEESGVFVFLISPDSVRSTVCKEELGHVVQNGKRLIPIVVRDERELPRTRMALCKIRVALKNRIHATLAKYNLSLPTESDSFAPKWPSQLNQVIEQLPPETQNCLQQEVVWKIGFAG